MWNIPTGSQRYFDLMEEDWHEQDLKKEYEDYINSEIDNFFIVKSIYYKPIKDFIRINPKFNTSNNEPGKAYIKGMACSYACGASQLNYQPENSEFVEAWEYVLNGVRYKIEERN